VRTEIERKFLVTGDGWRAGAAATPIRQGYLAADSERSVRVRVSGERAFLTIKGTLSGFTRAEYEYEIPVADAHELLDGLCLRPLIEKTRHTLRHAGVEWVVDAFTGDNAGLVVAEVELESEDQAIDLPAWVGAEVTDDPRYLNVNLARHPYSAW
jgi:adenylate cyclase